MPSPDRARHDRIHVIESLVTGDAPSTKAAKALLAGLTGRKNMLIVLDRTDFVSLMSVRNLADVHVLAVDRLNTYDVLAADDVVFTKAAFEIFVSGGAQSFAGAEAEDASDGTTAVAPAAFAAVTQAPAERPPAPPPRSRTAPPPGVTRSRATRTRACTPRNPVAAGTTRPSLSSGSPPRTRPRPPPAPRPAARKKSEESK